MSTYCLYESIHISGEFQIHIKYITSKFIDYGFAIHSKYVFFQIHSLNRSSNSDLDIQI